MERETVGAERGGSAREGVQKAGREAWEAPSSGNFPPSLHGAPPTYGSAGVSVSSDHVLCLS